MDCLKSVLDEFEKIPKSVPRFDLIGNHELYLFPRNKISSSKQSPLNTSRLDPILGEESTWYSYVASPGFRVVILDAFDISTMNGEGNPNTAKAYEYLAQHNPNDVKT